MKLTIGDRRVPVSSLVVALQTELEVLSRDSAAPRSAARREAMRAAVRSLELVEACGVESVGLDRCACDSVLTYEDDDRGVCRQCGARVEMEA